jgi:hypothetical protein
VTTTRRRRRIRSCGIMNIRDCKSGEIKRKAKKVDVPIEEEQAGNEVACVRWDSLNCARCLAQDTPWPPSPALRGHAAELQSCRHGPALLFSLSLSRIPFLSFPFPAPLPIESTRKKKMLLSNI